MPAAAVIPAPLAYIKVVAVKTLVVEYLVCSCWCGPSRALRSLVYNRTWSMLFRHLIECEAGFFANSIYY